MGLRVLKRLFKRAHFYREGWTTACTPDGDHIADNDFLSALMLQPTASDCLETTNKAFLNFIITILEAKPFFYLTENKK